MKALIPRKWTPYERMQLIKANRLDLLNSLSESDLTPVEYLTQRVEFLGHVFEVTPDVLIPRVETEDLVQLLLADLKNRLTSAKKLRIVEVGTGSGVIGLSAYIYLLSQQLTTPIELVMTDISDKALVVAQKNYCKFTTQFGGSPQITVKFMQMDLLSAWPTTAGIDVLIANLPYIPSSGIPTLVKEVRDFEPTIALDGGRDGWKLILKLLTQATGILSAGNAVFLETDDSHSVDQLRQLIQGYSFEAKPDCFGVSRHLVGRRVIAEQT